ncbi:hypothetical protein CMQ_7232 [Grosmannia clavigera kw1407]|uniref:Uncharacterized protein n=1 Tax=Grosmannia clavigera (strain kw1407 / UAMH 11150) TaxID=655863 RepID=F0XNP9_GROCL|nr:uncharacterized protein CMQ_7232 [Grosmannia clavigera kw1407]EFX00230.1 hypothetical protein CMQ_7232 [Grosmannia clavigera kw1407]
MNSPNWKDAGRLASFLQPYEEVLSSQEAAQEDAGEVENSLIAAPPYPWANQGSTSIEEHIGVLEDAVMDAITCGKQLVNVVKEFEVEGRATFPPSVVSEIGKNEGHAEECDNERDIDGVDSDIDDVLICEVTQVSGSSAKDASGSAGQDEDDEANDESQGLEHDFSEFTDPIFAVWKLEEEDLRSMTTADILTEADPATGFLSTTKSISCQDLETFADEIKPFLDCTPLPGVETINGGEMQVWPLVQRVDLYVPSPILKNGVVIEDLPGLSDAVTMRANVARERFTALEIAIIVSPVSRAGDEQLASQLISDNEALRMELDGKFTRHNFCVVPSKMDDIPWEQYLKKTLRPAAGTEIHTAHKAYKEICQQLKEIKSKMGAANKELEEARADRKVLLKCAEDGHEQARVQGSVSSARSKLAELTQRNSNLEARLTYYKGLMTFLCIKARNARVEKKILMDMRRKKARFRKNKTGPFTEEAINVLPVSSSSFWNLQNSESTPSPGFPAVEYTGIPALRAWINRATIPARQNHALSILHRLNAVLNVLWTWSMEESLDSRDMVSPKERLEELCTKFKNTLRQNLGEYGDELTARVQQCNPLAIPPKQRFKPQCRSNVIEAVKTWNLLWPSRPRSPKMHWATHLAIIRRNGKRYTSTGAGRVTYAWMDNMADVVLLGIVEMWNEAFHSKLPAEAEKVKGRIEEIWNRSMFKVRWALPALFPTQLEYLSGQLVAIMELRQLVAHNVENAMFRIAVQAAEIHKLVGEILSKNWSRGFFDARKIIGKGSFGLRQNHFEKLADKNTTPLVKLAMMKMDQQIMANMDHFRQSLDAIWDDGLAKIDNQIDAICQRIAQAEQDSDAAVETGRSTGLELRKAATPLVIKWQTDWKLPDVIGRMQAGLADAAIPKTYVDEPRGATFDPLSSDGEDWAYEPEPPKPPKRRVYKKRIRDEGGEDTKVKVVPKKRAPAKKRKTGNN